MLDACENVSNRAEWWKKWRNNWKSELIENELIEWSNEIEMMKQSNDDETPWKMFGECLASHKQLGKTAIRRNPITGEISAIQQSPSRCNSVLLKKPIAVNNGTNSSSLPVTPTFNRNNITISSTNGTNNLSNSSIASSCLSINSNTSSSSPSQ